MSKSLPPLTWFRSFEAAARHLSFTAAAEEIGLTQSAVSQQVKALETRLRAPLFVRKPRGLALTDDGRRLLPQVGAALESLAIAAAEVVPARNQRLLTVAASVSVTHWLISPRLPDFAARHPEVRLRFLSAIWPDDFQSSTADVDIRFGSAKQVGDGAELLGPDWLIPVKAPHLEGELDALPLIEAVGTSSGWQAWQEVHGALRPPAIFADTYGMALQLAADGNGVALISALLASTALESGQVCLAYARRIPCQEGYFLSARRASEDAQIFADWLREALKIADFSPPMTTSQTPEPHI